MFAGLKIEVANISMVNNSPIGPEAYAIQNGDIIELAGIKMEFNLAN